MAARIIVTHYRYERPPPKKEPRPVELAAAVVVHAPKVPADERGKKGPVTRLKAPPHRPAGHRCPQSSLPRVRSG
jgi:hypothetical protein